MATKKRSSSKSASKPTIDPDRAKDLAKIALRPSANAAAVIHDYGKMFGDHDINDLIAALVESIDKVNDGDMKRCEGMLMAQAQAQALQSIFTYLSRKALNQDYLKSYEGFMRMALKAQNQCRMTLETLSSIKNPPVVYAKQANISNGPQQVNNGVPATHAENNQKQPNELLEVIDGERLDTGTAQETIGSDQAMATVE